MTLNVCDLCGKGVDPDNDETYHEVKSWVNGPKLDGPKLRERTGRLAHKHCIDAMVAGQAPDQPTIFEESTPQIWCLERAKKGTGEGACDTYYLGTDCPNSGNHL